MKIELLNDPSAEDFSKQLLTIESCMFLWLTLCKKRMMEIKKVETQKRRNILNFMQSNKIDLIKRPIYTKIKLYSHQKTLRWHRKQFGLYGNASGINPAICFTTKEEIDDIKEYEKVAYDKSFIQLRNEALQRLEEEKKQYRIREEEIERKLENMEKWKEQIRQKMNVKQIEVVEAKQKRERLLEEVRRFFGYTIDPKDEKFQIMLELKEKEQKKLEKAEKKKMKEERFLAKLASLEHDTSKNTNDDKEADKEK
ncbi:hypothetical protein PGB90_004136 [Kerria lacca]